MLDIHSVSERNVIGVYFVPHVLNVLFVLIVPDDSALYYVCLIYTAVYFVLKVLYVPYVLVVPHVLSVPYITMLFGSNVLIVLFVLLVPDDSAVSDMLDILIIIQRKKADVFVVPRVLLVLYVLVVTHVLCSIL